MCDYEFLKKKCSDNGIKEEKEMMFTVWTESVG